ncbi:MAG: diacylglycerol kinase family protein [Anaerolineae bacterium]|nr:diacylglycerol kinase family protein [Anaerolineae bacterium]
MKPRHRNGFLMSFKYAGEGVWHAVQTQRNFRVHLLAAVAVVTLGQWLGLPATSWAILILTIASVLWAEIINTAAETLVDLVSPDYHPLAKQVKDLAAGAVLVMAAAAVVIGLLLLGPPLLMHLGTL